MWYDLVILNQQFLMKTAISIPDDIYIQADELAKRLGVSRSELYTQAIALYLKTHSRELITDKLNQVYTNSDNSLDPCLLRLQLLSLTPETW